MTKNHAIELLRLSLPGLLAAGMSYYLLMQPEPIRPGQLAFLILVVVSTVSLLIYTYQLWVKWSGEIREMAAAAREEPMPTVTPGPPADAPPPILDDRVVDRGAGSFTVATNPSRWERSRYPLPPRPEFVSEQDWQAIDARVIDELMRIGLYPRPDGLGLEEEQPVPEKLAEKKPVELKRRLDVPKTGKQT